MNKTPTAAWIETPTACYLVGDPNYSPRDAYEDARAEAMIEAQEEYEDQREESEE